MSHDGWYEVVEGPDLLQGDLLDACPLPRFSVELPCPLGADPDLRLRVETFHLVVMSQSCDLVNDKVAEVLLARRMAWSEVVRAEGGHNPVLRSAKFRKALVDGNIPSMALLHKRDTAPGLPWSLVDFHALFTVPKSYLSRFAAANRPRLRLRSPYREHLAQAFARLCHSRRPAAGRPCLRERGRRGAVRALRRERKRGRVKGDVHDIRNDECPLLSARL